MTPVTIASNSVVAAGAAPTNWSAKGTFAVPPLLSCSDPTGAPIDMVPFGKTVGAEYVAQSFTPSASGDIAAIHTILSKSGTVVDNIYIEIQTDSSGTPSGTALGVSDDVIGSNLTAVQSVVSFSFSSPIAVTSGVRYWFLIRRSGALGFGNYSYWRGLNTLISENSKTYSAGWSSAVSADIPHAIEMVGDPSLYQITQDTSVSPKLHAWKSTDNGASWTELDSANAPSVYAATAVWSACWSPFEGIEAAYCVSANTARVRSFSTWRDVWGSDVGGADITADVAMARNIQIVANGSSRVFYFTSLADDADIRFYHQTGDSGWVGWVAVLSVSSAESSLVTDALFDPNAYNFAAPFFYDVANGDYSVRSVATGGSQGTAIDLSAAAATTESSQATGRYAPYEDAGVAYVVAAFINADNSVQERTASLGVTSASMVLGTQHQVTSSTSYAGKHLATCQYNGDLYVFASTGTGIDYFVDTGATGTWSAATNWKSGLTNCYLSQATPTTDGILVVYNDNGDVKCDVVGASAPEVFEGERTAASSVAISYAAERTATTELALRTQHSRQVSASLALSTQHERTAPASVAIAITQSRSASAQAAVAAQLERLASSAVSVRARLQRTTMPSVALVASHERTAPASVATSQQYERTATPNAAILTSQQRTAATALAIQSAQEREASASVALTTSQQRTAAASVSVAAQAERSATAHAAVAAQLDRTAAATVATSTTHQRTAAAQAAVTYVFERAAAAAVAVRSTLQRAAASAVAVQTEKPQRTATVSVAVTTSLERSAAVGVAVQTAQERTAASTAALSTAHERTGAATAALSTEQTRSAACAVSVAYEATRTAESSLSLLSEHERGALAVVAVRAQLERGAACAVAVQGVAPTLDEYIPAGTPDRSPLAAGRPVETIIAGGRKRELIAAGRN